MKTTVMVTDIFVRFRLCAIAETDRQSQAWEMEVMCIEQVADILTSLGFLDSKAASRLAKASTTITPQPGITTIPLSTLAAVVEFADPDFEPVSPEAQEGHVLIAHGGTTEEALASAGFVLKTDHPVQ